MEFHIFLALLERKGGWEQDLWFCWVGCCLGGSHLRRASWLPEFQLSFLLMGLGGRSNAVSVPATPM